MLCSLLYSHIWAGRPGPLSVPPRPTPIVILPDFLYEPHTDERAQKIGVSERLCQLRSTNWQRALPLSSRGLKPLLDKYSRALVN